MAREPTQRDLIIRALEARGERRADAIRTNRYVVLVRTAFRPKDVTTMMYWFVGKAGALRTGFSVTSSIPVSPRFRDALLREGSDLASKPAR